jgi:hypothetical protein
MTDDALKAVMDRMKSMFAELGPSNYDPHNITGKYILVDRVPVECRDLILWATWYGDATESGDRIVAQDKIGDYFVSTVFLGIDQSFYFRKPRTPILFETMVFIGDKNDGTQVRYATWNEAAEGHREVCKRLRDL